MLSAFFVAQALHTCNELGTCILLSLEHKTLGPALVQEDMDLNPKHEGLAPRLGCKRWALQCPSPAGSPGPTPPFTSHFGPTLEHEVVQHATEQPTLNTPNCPSPGAWGGQTCD